MSKDAFAQGKLAFAHNQPMSACEYPISSSLRKEWMEGWTSARNAAPNPPNTGSDNASAPSGTSTH
jgi:hypothetical protein